MNFGQCFSRSSINPAIFSKFNAKMSFCFKSKLFVKKLNNLFVNNISSNGPSCFSHPSQVFGWKNMWNYRETWDFSSLIKLHPHCYYIQKFYCLFFLKLLLTSSSLFNIKTKLKQLIFQHRKDWLLYGWNGHAWLASEHLIIKQCSSYIWLFLSDCPKCVIISILNCTIYQITKKHLQEVS